MSYCRTGPTHLFVMRQKAMTLILHCLATVASWAMDMPTQSTPIFCSAATSAGVSY